MSEDKKATLNEQKSKANEAKSLRENPAFKRTMETIRTEIYEQWKSSLGPEKEQRENAYIMSRLLDRFEALLNEDVVKGANAKRLLEEIEKTETETET